MADKAHDEEDIVVEANETFIDRYVMTTIQFVRSYDKIYHVVPRPIDIMCAMLSTLLSTMKFLAKTTESPLDVWFEMWEHNYERAKDEYREKRGTV